MVNKHAEGHEMAPIVTGGGAENLRLVDSGEVEFSMEFSAPASDAEPLSKIFLPSLRFVILFVLLVSMMIMGYSPFRTSLAGLIALLIGCFLFEWRDLDADGRRKDDVLLKAGDVVVQRGTNHAWANRGA